MIRNRHWYFLILGTLGACTSTISPDMEQLGASYFPIGIGMFHIYDTKVITYNSDLTIDTSFFQLKEVMADTFTNVSGGTSYMLDRFRRESISETWQIDSVWSLYKDVRNVVVIEHNVPIIKMSFPIEEGLTWDGNAMNAKDTDDYELRDIGMTFTIDEFIYDNTLTVFHEELLDPRMISRDDYRLEVFGKDAGLVYSIDVVRKYCKPEICETPVVENGIIFEQRLIEVGFE